MKSGKGNRAKHRRAGRAVRGGTSRLRKNGSAPAPLKDSTPSPNQTENGSRVMRPETDGIRLPEALVEASGTVEQSLIPGRFMSTVTILAIVFIAIIAWFVSQMPDK